MIRPVQDKVVVKEDEAPERIGKIWTPRFHVKPQSPTLPHTGVVLAVGKSEYGVRAGDHVIFERMSPMQVVDIDCVSYLVMKEQSILAKLED